MLTRAHLSAREGVALLVLVLLPLAVMVLLAWRAASNERVAVQGSMRAELEHAASQAGVRYERALAALTREVMDAPDVPVRTRLPFVQPLEATAEQLSAEPVRPPSPVAGRVRKAPPAQCSVWLKALQKTAAQASQTTAFLRQCEGAHARDGRYGWPLLAFHPGAAARPDAAAIRGWFARYGDGLSPVEREAIRMELQQSKWLPEPARSELVQLARPPLQGPQSVLALVRDKLRGRANPAEVRWADARSRGVLVRQSSGGYRGYVVDRSTLLRALAAGWPGAAEGMAAQLVAARVEQPNAFEALPKGPHVVLSWQRADELSRRTVRSWQLLWISAAVAAMGLMALVWLLGSRLRAQRQLSALRTDFVAAVSHELRTPIASLRVLSELLADEAIEPEEVPEARRALVQEAERLGETVDQLLSFSRMQAGKLRAQLASCDLSAEIEQFADAFEARHQQAIERSIEPQIQISVDVAAVKMALRNLLDNARKHAPQGAPYRLQLRRGEGGVALSVSDHGPGIAARFQRQIFQPFERVDDRLSRATEGSGIGLSLVRHVAASHGGRVSVQSKLGEGATFTIWLPEAERS